MKRKLLSILLAAALICSLGSSMGEAISARKADAAVSDVSVRQPAQPFVELTGEELTADMGAGWNLGNTMDGHTGFTPSETVWQNVRTTKKLIQSVHDLGFNTVRIPVTWGTMIDDSNDYAIDEAWLSRVQDIVDYCISQDMYAIINIHHDGADQMSWLNIGTEDQKALEEKFMGVWKNISTPFKDYDEHLILESMNEVQASGMSVPEQNQVIMKLNQIFVDTVRATGSNNAKRWLMVPGKFNYIDSVCNEANGFALPKDTVKNRIIVSVHDYTTGSFTHTEGTSKAATTYSIKKLGANDKELKPLYDMYTSKGIPVVVGEYGCKNKDNMAERAFYLEGLNRMFQKYNLVGVYWDQGWFDRSLKPDYSFSIINRKTGKPIEKQVTDAIMRGYFGSTDDYTTLKKNPKVVPMKKLKVSKSTLNLAVNESRSLTVSYTPSNSNDVVLWKTEDASVATVAYGKVQAKGIGSTKITAFSQSGKVSGKITVKVTAAKAAVPCKELSVETTKYSLQAGQTAYLSPVIKPEETTESLYYQSSDDSVVTVSSIGKLVAVGAGEAVVKVCTSGGKAVPVKVTVTEEAISKEVRLSINVYYNDSVHDYYLNEISNNVISVSQNGQYTLSFDCSSDLSDAAKAAGVSNLNNVTAIYIKDYDVATGKTEKTPFTTCQIRYDKIVVDDTELTLTGSAYKSALKNSGIFDTNDPINAWDGSAVKEVKTSNHVASFSDISNPRKISVTFTLKDISFESEEPEPEPEQPSDQIAEVKKGDVITKGDGVYKVTSVSNNSRSVAYVKPAKKGLKRIVIPDSVTIDKKRYQVTSVAANALKNNKAVTKLSIGKNIKKIGNKAFYGCKKLSSITIKTTNLTLNRVGAQAFGNGNKKIRVTVPKKKTKLYKKIAKKRGISSKAKIAGKK